MFGHRELQMEDYMAMLRRRLWWILVPLLLGPVVGYGISRLLPNEYTSSTLMLVEQQKVPESYVRTVFNDDLAERLATMQEQILSRTRLQPIIERFGLYKEDQGKLPMEELVARMRSRIGVTAVKAAFTGSREGFPGFYISFTDDNPRIAQQVCAEITSMFMAENLKSREQSAQGTTEFLSKQLEDAKRKLDELDRQIAEFKQKYLGTLPGQEQGNMNLLMSYSAQLETVNQALNRLEQDKAYAETLLAQQLEAMQGTDTASPQTLDQQLTQAQATLNLLESRYTTNHPDVIKQRLMVERLKKKIAEVAAAPKEGAEPTSASRVEPSNIQQMRVTLHNMEQTIQEKKVAQRRLQQQIALYQGRVQSSPVIEEQAKQLTRDYDIALKFYNDLLAKKTQSEMATDMERRQQGQNFRVMDPASLPEKPSFPNRQLFAAAGGMLGLGLGLGLAFLIEMRDKSLRNEKDIEFYLELPTLAIMPTVGSTNGTRRFWKRKQRKAAGKKAARKEAALTQHVGA